MYECPNCAANLQFDIPSQKLRCRYCGTSMDPYDFQKERDVEETTVGEDEYEVTVFICPQCGGELISNDTTAATFCSFCGGSTILDRRIGREKRPKHIIPFRKTKEDCKEAYAKLMRKALFAPSELKDQECIERFRSIYMPYWVYDFEKEGHVAFTGTQSKRSGDYKIIRSYQIEGDVLAKYKGLTFDAAASFSDNLSNAIAPFEWREARPFTPAFLSGFYADTGDVTSEVYQEDAQTLVHDELCAEMKKDYVCKKYELGEDFVHAMKPDLTSQTLAMLPVWFLAYRKKDRVNYVVVNGQTGKAAGDIPVDKGKYLLGSFLSALPVFVLFNLFFSLRAPTMLVFTIALALVCCMFSVLQTKMLRSRESGMDDKGKLGGVEPEPPTGGRIMSWEKIYRKLTYCFMYVVMTCLIAFVYFNVDTTDIMSEFIWENLLPVLFIIVMLSYGVIMRGISKVYKRTGKYRITWGEFWKAVAKPGIGILFSALVLIINPVSDLFYYGAALLAMGMVGWSILDLIEKYNRLVTRELPHFDKRGGEEDGR